MRRTKLFAMALALLMLLTVTDAYAHSDGDDNDGLSLARRATARFRDLDAAKAAGYGGPLTDLAGITCIANPGAGVMGIHYVNGGLVGDAVLDAARPEALVYQPRPNGKLRLVAAEYVVFQDKWLAAGHTEAPELFGQPLTLVPAGNRFGLPAFYEIHAWIWMHNPAGMFADWNPRGSCGEQNETQADE